MSEQLDFTKEKWVVCPTDLAVVERIGIPGRIAWRICSIFRSASRNRQQKTAVFIAAAPETAAERDRLRAENVELLAALKDAQSRLTNILAHANHLLPCNHDFCKRVNNALAHLCGAVDVAIAKAKG